MVQARGLLTRHVIDRYTGFFISRNVAPARVAIAVRAGVLFCFGPVRFCSLRTGVVGARFEPRARARLARSLSAEQPGTLRGSATHDTPPTLRRAPRPPRARRAAAPGGPGAHGMEWNGMECNILSASGDPGARHGDAARGRACRAAAHLVPPRALTSSRNARRLLGVVARRRSRQPSSKHTNAQREHDIRPTEPNQSGNRTHPHRTTQGGRFCSGGIVKTAPTAPSVKRNAPPKAQAFPHVYMRYCCDR